VLDVACGTGKSFRPLLRRGYEVTGCDISPPMLEQAPAGAPGVRLVPADMRALPDLGAFDLVTCLDDALNYLARDRAG
jgi:SAM-dependent methyltransferase